MVSRHFYFCINGSGWQSVVDDYLMEKMFGIYAKAIMFY